MKGITLPTGNRTLFSYFVDLQTDRFVLWDELVPSTDSLIRKGIVPKFQSSYNRMRHKVNIFWGWKCVCLYVCVRACSPLGISILTPCHRDSLADDFHTKYTQPYGQSSSSALVCNIDSIRYSFLLCLLLLNSQPVLLTGTVQLQYVAAYILCHKVA